MATRFLAPPPQWSRPPSSSLVSGCGFLPVVGVVRGGPSPLWVWLGLGGMKGHDLRSSLLSCGREWVRVSQLEELRKPL